MKVKHELPVPDLRKAWATFNEAWTLTYLASGYGKAPSVQPYMEMTVWPYVAGHNVILAHLKVGAVGSVDRVGAAVRKMFPFQVTQLFRQMQQDGSLSSEHKIFITNNQDRSNKIQKTSLRLRLLEAWGGSVQPVSVRSGSSV